MLIDIINMISGIIVALATASIPFIIRWLDNRQKQRQKEVGESNASEVKILSAQIQYQLR